jgi:hypothetical protein
MWYRQVGGVVEKPALKEQPPAHKANRALDELLSAAAAQSSLPGPEDSRSLPFQEEIVRDNGRDDIIDQFENGIGTHFEAKVSRQALETNRSQGLSYMLPNEGIDTLFFDDSTNVQDLPEDLDWFFEANQPGSMSTVDIVSGVSPLPMFQGVSSIPAPLSYPQQTPSPSTSTYESTWSIAQSRMISSLQSLPPELLESPFFNLHNLAMFYDLYFKNYHHHFPILHRPSLSVAEVHPLLLTAIVTLGATLAADPVFYFLGQQIHDALRWIILAVSTLC